jgi:hypothetical protein
MKRNAILVAASFTLEMKLASYAASYIINNKMVTVLST